MTAPWSMKTLAEACEIRPSKAEASRKLAPTDLVSFLPMEDLGIDQKLLVPTRAKPLGEVNGSYTYFADGDVLLAKITPCFENGKLGIAANLKNGVGFGSSEYIVFRPAPSVDKEWLYYFLSRDAFRKEGAERMSGAVGHKRVAKEFVESCSIPIPPIAEQRRIVRILDEAFAGIAAAQTNSEKNLQNASSLFGSCLEDVFAKHDGQGAENNKPLADLCELIVDCEHKTAPTQEEGIPSIRTPNIGKGKLLLAGVYRVSEGTYREWTRRAEPLPGDLILAREAPAGNVAVIPQGLKVCLGQRTVLIRPKRNVFEPEFLAFLLLQPRMQEMLLAHSRGATVQHVNMKDIRALNISHILPLAMQQDVVSRVNAVSQESETLTAIYERKLAALRSLRASLLQGAFSGAL